MLDFVPRGEMDDTRFFRLTFTALDFPDDVDFGLLGFAARRLVLMGLSFANK